VSNISWRSNDADAQEVDPLRCSIVYSRWQRQSGRRKPRQAAMYRKSILDFVADDAKRLDRSSATRQQKMDEFEHHSRNRKTHHHDAEAGTRTKPPIWRVRGHSRDMTEHMHLMCDCWCAWQMTLRESAR